MYDFAKHGILNNNSFAGAQLWTETAPQDPHMPQDIQPPEKSKKTPKQLFKLRTLNDNKFAIRNGNLYLEQQIEDIKEKLDLIGPEKKFKKSNGPTEFEMGGTLFGREELKSMLERLHNRFRLNEFTNILEKYPHTTNTLINDVITNNTHLQAGKAEDFVPDFPKDAVKAMTEYNNMCIALCYKKTNFYVIAKHEDFQQKNKRRDPMLIAQSPFGFFWQVLGAWDEEMIYLGDL